ncbi:MAG: hypothetical protein A3I29_02145 [Candidatus Magasanikbacteria bacterium RIFCSPLOWO2_02_FULL_44_11]|uniref:Ribosomal RNA small subunit methyltransferase E n=2 Tax=Candidatus Magasanikiibacteriota TaxID=1752731 RepID=A0A1F6NB01_9BACT|nr:MAG: hypothetical protein A3D53_01530 [Candidatus Magasanikbacteria bacterium RIFCSPHIGHO2_02_FULL_45_10]OGH81092.1 MAG: hypothetical protein A3I29_02145 [Candidatus Magasanikbacteria bacterium RIFCSPLOWO2_02_FULL_44_11]
MHRFFVQDGQEASFVSLKNPEQVHQIRDVLKLQPGEQITLVLANGDEAVCEITSFGKNDLSLGVVERRKNAAEPVRQVTLFCAVLKRDHFELVVEKATEAGVSVIVPVITSRTVKLGVQEERLKKIMREAAEQSGRGVVPKLMPIMNFASALEDIKKFDDAIFFDMAKQMMAEKDVVGKKSIALFVGPEGGWTPEERSVAEAAGCAIRSLGPLTLRSETAAIVATYNAIHF